MEVDNYEAFVTRGKRRFRVTVISMLVGLIGLLYLPWLLVPELIKKGSAELCTVLCSLLLVAAWRALMTKVADRDDAPEPTEQSRHAHLRMLLTVAGGILATNVAFAIVFFAAGWIGQQGIIFAFGWSAMMGAMLGRALLRRGVGI